MNDKVSSKDDQSQFFLTRRNRRFVVLFALLCLIATALQLWLMSSEIPLGVPNEWTWPRFDVSVETLRWLPLIGAGLIGLGITYFAVGRHRRTSRVSSELKEGVWLAGLVLFGLLWVNALSSAMFPSGGLSRSVFVLFYPRTTGYYWQAKYEVDDLAKFLKEYEASIQDQSNPENYLHIGTHPPGLTIGYRALLNLCDASPGLVAILESVQPDSVREALQFLKAAHRSEDDPLSRSDLAALWLAVLLSQFLSVLTVIPLYFLSRRVCHPPTSRIVAAMWLMVPAVLVFLPKSDAVFPCLACWIQWFWIKAMEKESRFWGATTAVALISSAMLSLAFFTIGLILLLQLVHQEFYQRTGRRETFSGAIVGLAMLGAIYEIWNVNLPGIWFQNFQNHAAFYDHNTRTYLSWLMVNVVEVFFALGAPLALLAFCGMLTLCFQFRERNAFLVLSGLIAWSALWISGKNQGEAARLWMFLMPYAALAAGPFLDRLLGNSPTISKETTTDDREGKPLQPWTLPLISLIISLQIMVCIWTAIVVDGFGFTQL